MTGQIDSLQDICIFYCVNHLDTLASLLECSKQSSDEATASFSMLLGNRILEYYFKSHIAEDALQGCVDAVISNPQFCNSIFVNRKNMLTCENVSNLAQNAIKELEFTCFDDYRFIKDEFEILVQQNLKNLTRLKVKQKSTECDIEGLLQLLAGGDGFESKRKYGTVSEQDKNTNHPKEKKTKKCLRYFSKLRNFDKSSKAKTKSVSSHSCHPDAQLLSSTQNDPEVQSTKMKTSPSSSDSDMTDPTFESLSDTEISAHQKQRSAEQCIPNLFSFHYNMCYSSLENLTNSYSVFDRLCCIIEKNTQLQSITIVSVMPNPCKWFLLNTDMVHKLENLHSLVLSHATKKNMDIELGSVLFSRLPELKKLR